VARATQRPRSKLLCVPGWRLRDDPTSFARQRETTVHSSSCRSIDLARGYRDGDDQRAWDRHRLGCRGRPPSHDAIQVVRVCGFGRMFRRRPCSDGADQGRRPISCVINERSTQRRRAQSSSTRALGYPPSTSGLTCAPCNHQTAYVVSTAITTTTPHGDDLRREPLDVRKATLRSLLVKTGAGLRWNEHIEGDGETILRHVCKRGLEGIVSKRKDSPYRSGRSPMAQDEEPLGARSEA
jgi:hypothetical protein